MNNMTKFQKFFVPITAFFALPALSFFLGLINLASDLAVCFGVVGALSVITIVAYDVWLICSWIANKISTQTTETK